MTLIQGQSNSVASNFSGSGPHANVFKDKFIRSFGSSSNKPSLSFIDTFWHDAEGDLSYIQGSIGQWGMVLAKSLLDSFNIPKPVKPEMLEDIFVKWLPDKII